MSFFKRRETYLQCKYASDTRIRPAQSRPVGGTRCPGSRLLRYLKLMRYVFSLLCGSCMKTPIAWLSLSRLVYISQSHPCSFLLHPSALLECNMLKLTVPKKISRITRHLAFGSLPHKAFIHGIRDQNSLIIRKSSFQDRSSLGLRKPSSFSRVYSRDLMYGCT